MVDSGEILCAVRAFVADPANRGNFDRFFRLCLRLAETYVKVLARHSQLNLPHADFPRETAHQDFAADCIADLFPDSTADRPFPRLVDYLTRKITVTTPPAQAKAILQGMIEGWVRQRIAKRRPGAANILRAVDHALALKNFEQVRIGNAGFWALRTTHRRRRRHLPAIDDTTLRNMCLEVCPRSANMPDRCCAFFESLDQDGRFRNFIEPWRLRNALVKVLADHDDFRPYALPDPERDYLAKSLRILSENAVETVRSEELQRLANERSFTDAERCAFGRALAAYAADFVTHGGADRKPDYLKMFIEPWNASQYLKRYKYTWDAVTYRCIRELRRLLCEEGFGPE